MIAVLVPHPMLHAVMFFGALGIVPAVNGADQIAGDATDAFKLLWLENVIDVDIVVASG